MHHQEFDPPEELRDAIKCFWYNRREFGETVSSFEVMPDGYAEIVFYFGSPISISQNGTMQELTSPFIMGLLNQPAMLYAKNRLEIIAVRCFPWTVFDLLGLPSGKDGLRLFEHPVAKLQSVLNSFIQDGKMAEAIAEVKQYLLKEFSQTANELILSKAGTAMKDSGGTLPVSEVAAAAHATVRTLERKFKQSSGYSVKDVSGLMRFEQVRNRLWHHPESGLAGLAHELGYSDQSHLSREFKRYSGSTPAAFARKANKGNPFLKSDFVAFVQS